MKIVINRCYGGFSISREAVKMMAQMQGRKCFFFECDLSRKGDRYVPTSDKSSGGHDLFWDAFDISNPNEVFGDFNRWHELNSEERRELNRLHEEHSFDTRDIERNDPMLIEIVEKLGEKANGGYAELEIVEIPDGIEWQIEEYDGMEWIAEKHKTWR